MPAAMVLGAMLWLGLLQVLLLLSCSLALCLRTAVCMLVALSRSQAEELALQAAVGEIIWDPLLLLLLVPVYMSGGTSSCRAAAGGCVCGSSKPSTWRTTLLCRWRGTVTSSCTCTSPGVAAVVSARASASAGAGCGSAALLRVLLLRTVQPQHHVLLRPGMAAEHARHRLSAGPVRETQQETLQAVFVVILAVFVAKGALAPQQIMRKVVKGHGALLQRVESMLLTQ
ncbi:hypothetical protein COO60DRAFT_1563123 [Scenedesmus sp. NREL 46B-D3]|nr:hypothetical protein COO60DRAFT_1563123 [Scenedesmus sp. NREL 46B-D3]